ncbi:hypothetical protein CB0940_03848 [Cercospora beticola]|uniref:Uncharacterized protein n=1 Tax=Cercospora beticola TaxID=122368 RepID=A0A2G5HMA8_CERBT|nr:hypothetical protein CB0940_03848 [Cercospora beticola]PIA93670.1 hypothetical protein CB0940_03848 [Cercospora beticola]WPB01047.1 hypothetical protein RHO25_005667 [Cercospora beticola]CAK1364217.1 unnamed protein product [Cercospora beticola]
MLDCAKSGGHSRFGLRLRPRPPIDRAGRPRVDTARAELIYDRLPGLLELSTLDLVGFSRMEVTIARKPFSWPRVLDHLVVECPDAKLHLDSTADAGESFGFTDSFSKQYWTNQTGDQIGATSETKWERGRIKMRLGSDGRLFADFKLHFQTPSSDNVPEEYLDTCVHVEADPEPLSPVLVVHCWRGTSHSVKVSAQEKLRVLRVGSSRTFKLDAGESLQVKAGLILEAGEGVWRLNLARKKSETICKSDGGIRDATSALFAEQQACPHSDHNRPCCSASAVQSTIDNAADVRALLQELTDLRGNLRSLYQESVSGAENIVQRLESGRSSRSGSRGTSAEGEIALSTSTNVMREREDTELKTIILTTDSGSVDVLAEHNKTIGGEQPAVAEAQIEVKTFMSFMHSGPYYELEANAIDGRRPEETAAGSPIEPKAFASLMHSEPFDESEAEDTNGLRATVAHIGVEPVEWILGIGTIPRIGSEGDAWLGCCGSCCSGGESEFLG